jgi:transposase
MDLQAYEQLVSSESSAKKYVAQYCFILRHRFCPRCRCRKLYRLSDGRRRCSRCEYTFQELAGRWLSQCRLSCTQWLRMVKLFELEVSTRKMAQQLGVSYKTAYKAITTIRMAILAQGEEGKRFLGKGKEIELDESYFGGRRKGRRGRGAAGKVPVFGILERKGQVLVEVVPDVTAETLLTLTVKTVRRGSIVYTDRFKSYDSLMFCGYRHLKVDHSKRFARGRVYINGLEGFWSFAKERLHKYHGISPERFPLYLKELEFRYNHRKEDIFPLLVKRLADLVPNRT